MTTADRQHASEQLLAFLGQVGPIEATWAMTTALGGLQDLPASADHIAATRRAFAEALTEICELTAETAVAKPEEPSAARGKKTSASVIRDA